MSKLRKSAKGRDCQVRYEGVCNFNPETTVLCHVNGAGMGIKKKDLHGAWACSACHSKADRLPAPHHIIDFEDAIDLLKFWEAVFRTQEILVQEKLIKEG
jgi:hypothetical protein